MAFLACDNNWDCWETPFVWGDTKPLGEGTSGEVTFELVFSAGSGAVDFDLLRGQSETCFYGELFEQDNHTPSCVVSDASFSFDTEEGTDLSVSDMDLSQPEVSEGYTSEYTASSDRGFFSCPYSDCELRFSTQSEFRAHKRGSHLGPVRALGTNQSEGFVCPNRAKKGGGDCLLAFPRPWDLERHQLTVHVKERSFACTECSRTPFTRVDGLRRHYKGVHPGVTLTALHLQPTS